MTVSQSGEIYTILTIGDGLVAQIPALILSTATAIIITRSNMDEDKFANQSVSQLGKRFEVISISWYRNGTFWFCSWFPNGYISDYGTSNGIYWIYN